MMKEKVSIIIPVYEVEKYIERCIKCIQSQSYENWEAIFVEDGSPDKSGEICDSYATLDARIKVIHKENQGVAAARNTGLANVTGDFIVFIDSDDYAHPKLLETLIALQHKEKADLVIVGYQLSYGDEMIEPISRGNIQIMDSSKAIERIIENQQFCSPWAKLYKKQLFEEIRYPEGAIYEDLMTAFEIFQKAKKIIYQDIPLYYYFQVSKSITRSEFHYGKLDEAKALQKQYEFVKKHVPELEKQALYKYIYNVFGHLMCLVKAEDDFGKEKYKEFCRIIKEDGNILLEKQQLSKKQVFRYRLMKHPFIYRMFYKITGKA